MKKESVILFYDKEGNLLLQDLRNMSKFGEEYGFFGGSTENNEDADETLKRELKEKLELDIQNARLFESHVFFSEYSEESIKRNFYLAPMPHIKKLKNHQEEIALLEIKACSNLKMLQGQLELLKKAHAYLLDEKIVKPKKK